LIVAQVRISGEAEADIDRIADYTTSTWGWRQTNQYLAKLEDGFDLLAQNPSIGRSCDSIRAGLRRFEIGRHVVFYLPESDGVLVVRVLHQQMLPNNYV
jgi:toxin ParE1/3/4